MMFEIFVPIFLFIVIWHFVYERVLLPTVLTKRKYELYEQRDRLRRLCLENNNSMDIPEYDYLSDHIHTMIVNLENINLIGLVMFHKFGRKKMPTEVLDEYSKRNNVLNNTSIKGIKELYDDTKDVTFNTAMLNSGSWLFYITPLLLFLIR